MKTKRYTQPTSTTETPFEVIGEDIFQRWIVDPVSFIQEIIITPYNEVTKMNVIMTTQQKNAIEAVAELVQARLKKFRKLPLTEREVELNNKFGVSVMAGKGLGKDGLASWLIIWFLSCFPNCKIPCVSVSQDQLMKVLWSEIAKWLAYSPAKAWLTLQSDKVFFNEVDDDLKGKQWFAFPKTASPKSSVEEQVETLSGIHADYMMIVIDEASGIPDPVFHPLEGTMTQPCNFAFMIFNPTRSKGYAIDSQYKSSEYWLTLRWDAEESEIADRQVIERVREKYGVNSTPWRVRIKGLPPLVDEDTLIPMDWIMDAVNRDLNPLENDPVVQGVDCGAGGDFSVVVTRKGGAVKPIRRMKTPDSQTLINWVETSILEENPDTVRVDNIGIGWAVYGALSDKFGSKVESADARKQAGNIDKFHNKRAEMYWTLREKFEKGLISIPDDSDLIDELSAIKVSYEAQGKVKIADKAKLRQEIGHSPDEADALAMTYYFDDIPTLRARRNIYCHRTESSPSPLGWMHS